MAAILLGAGWTLERSMTMPSHSTTDKLSFYYFGGDRDIVQPISSSLELYRHKLSSHVAGKSGGDCFESEPASHITALTCLLHL